MLVSTSLRKSLPKSFVIGLIYPLNLTYIIPDEQTMFVYMFHSITPNTLVDVPNAIAIYIWNFLQSQHQRTLLYILRTKQ